MKKNDSLQVLNFNKDAWVGNDFDWSRLRAIKALRVRSYSEGKAIDKVLYNAIGNLLPKINKRGVVVISDGSVAESSFEKYSPEKLSSMQKAILFRFILLCSKIKIRYLKELQKRPVAGFSKRVSWTI